MTGREQANNYKRQIMLKHLKKINNKTVIFLSIDLIISWKSEKLDMLHRNKHMEIRISNVHSLYLHKNS